MSGQHAGPAHEGNSRTMGMHADEKSDGCIVPVKPRTMPSDIGGDGGGKAAGRGEGELQRRPGHSAGVPRRTGWQPCAKRRDRVEMCGSSPRPNVLIGAATPPESLSSAKQDVAKQHAGAETEKYPPAVPAVASPNMPVSADPEPTPTQPAQSTQGAPLQPSGLAEDVKAVPSNRSSNPRLKGTQPDKPKLASARRHAGFNHQAAIFQRRAKVRGGSPHEVNRLFPSREWEENTWRDSRRVIAGRGGATTAGRMTGTTTLARLGMRAALPSNDAIRLLDRS